MKQNWPLTSLSFIDLLFWDDSSDLLTVLAHCWVSTILCTGKWRRTKRTWYDAKEACKTPPIFADNQIDTLDDLGKFRDFGWKCCVDRQWQNISVTIARGHPRIEISFRSVPLVSTSTSNHNKATTSKKVQMVTSNSIIDMIAVTPKTAILWYYRVLKL